jgi:RNA polymerase sigma-70 factor, ECF subfamily
VSAARGPTGDRPVGATTAAVSPSPSPIESEIHALATAERFGDAVTVGIRGYGEELLGYLHALARDVDDAHDLFSELCQRMWQRLPQFRWQSSFRTWAYAVARNLAIDAGRTKGRRRARQVRLADVPDVEAIAEAMRSTTQMHMRSEAKRMLDRVRDTLDPDDRTLLVLSLDRRMTWREIAEVMTGGEAPPDDVRRVAARLRKRFERLKERLRGELALLAPTDGR